MRMTNAAQRAASAWLLSNALVPEYSALFPIFLKAQRFFATLRIHAQQAPQCAASAAVRSKRLVAQQCVPPGTQRAPYFCFNRIVFFIGYRLRNASC